MLKLSNIRIPVRIAVACLLPLLAFTALPQRSCSTVAPLLPTWTQSGWSLKRRR
jgi:hypothetical protein